MSDEIRKKSHGDLPATVRLVKEVRSELRAEIRSVRAEVKSFRAELKGEIQALDAKMVSGFSQMNSEFELLRADVHRTQVLMEEQRVENRIVLDGLKNLIDRQDRLERDHSQTRARVDSLGKARP